MKDGATDPFADEASEDEQTDESVRKDSQTDVSDHSDQSASTGETNTESASNTEQFDRSDLPKILARNSVKDDRDGGVHQLFLYQETADKEKDARRELEDRFDDDIYKLDAREAIYYAGMQNLDDAEELLREWGVDF